VRPLPVPLLRHSFGVGTYMAAVSVQGYLAHKKTPLPWDYHRALGIVLP